MIDIGFLIVSLVFITIGSLMLKFPDRLYDLFVKLGEILWPAFGISENSWLLRLNKNQSFRDIAVFIYRVFGALFTIIGGFFLIISIGLLCNPTG
jgi:hypothetical protein